MTHPLFKPLVADQVAALDLEQPVVVYVDHRAFGIAARYITPAKARQLAAELVEAADRAEQPDAPHPGQTDIETALEETA